ncbi:uncharacterized protein RAG0_07027 [Rhynchosporium agropyri]|uniref:Uncharacterized protein n=1 Tax=Rhynchosporium agropyri TaxID=914238 RepID=A0A1E1KJS2_9HELO|nr:uncharacterized protein RAG0_07027 [Rhynchosporium agropyri]
MAEHFSPLEKSLTLLKWLGQHHSFAKPGPLIAVLQCRTSFQAHYMARLLMSRGYSRTLDMNDDMRAYRDAHLVPPEYVNHYLSSTLPRLAYEPDLDSTTLDSATRDLSIQAFIGLGGAASVQLPVMASIG